MMRHFKQDAVDNTQTSPSNRVQFTWLRLAVMKNFALLFLAIAATQGIFLFACLFDKFLEFCLTFLPHDVEKFLITT